MDPQSSQSTIPPAIPATPVPLSTPSTSSTPANTPPKSSPLTSIAIVLLGVAVLAVVAYFVGTFASKKKAVSTPTPLVAPVTPTPAATADPTANWTKYTITTEPTRNLNDYEIKLPLGWARIEHSSNFQNIETFQDPQKKYKLVIDQEKNFNNQTQKPYSNLMELTGFSYEVDKIDIDTQEAAKILPRAGSESTYGVIFFSRENKTFYKITLETPFDGSLLDEGKLIFDQILSTFKFLEASPTPSATPM